MDETHQGCLPQPKAVGSLGESEKPSRVHSSCPPCSTFGVQEQAKKLWQRGWREDSSLDLRKVSESLRGGGIGRANVAVSLRSFIRVNDYRGAATFITSRPCLKYLDGVILQLRTVAK